MAGALSATCGGSAGSRGEIAKVKECWEFEIAIDILPQVFQSKRMIQIGLQEIPDV